MSGPSSLEKPSVASKRRVAPLPSPTKIALDPPGSVPVKAALKRTTFTKSQKVLNLRRDPRATLLVESGIEYAELKGVMIEAEAEVIEDTDLVADTLARINIKHRSGTEAEVEQMRKAVAATATKRVLLRFTTQRPVSWDHSRLGGRY